MSNFNIEKAKSNHVNGGILNYLAMAEMSHIMLGSDSKAEVVKDLQLLFENKGNRFSHDKSFVATVDGQHAGLVTCMSHQDMKVTTLETVKQLVKMKKSKMFSLVFNNFKDLISLMAFKESKSGEYHISLLATMPDYQGMGIASALIKKAENEARFNGFDKISLTVDKDNKNAKKLYEKLGFRVVEDSTFGQLKLWRMVKLLR